MPKHKSLPSTAQTKQKNATCNIYHDSNFTPRNSKTTPVNRVEWSNFPPAVPQLLLACGRSMASLFDSPEVTEIRQDRELDIHEVTQSDLITAKVAMSSKMHVSHLSNRKVWCGQTIVVKATPRWTGLQMISLSMSYYLPKNSCAAAAPGDSSWQQLITIDTFPGLTWSTETNTFARRPCCHVRLWRCSRFTYKMTHFNLCVII